MPDEAGPSDAAVPSTDASAPAAEASKVAEASTAAEASTVAEPSATAAEPSRSPRAAARLQPEAPRGTSFHERSSQKLRRGTSFYERDQVSIAASYEPSITRGRRRDNLKQKVRYLRERQRTLKIRETSTALPQRARRARLIVHPHGLRKMAWDCAQLAAIGWMTANPLAC